VFFATWYPSCGTKQARVFENGQVLVAAGQVKRSTGGFSILSSAALYSP
jgi:hypothetical protein